MRSEALLLDDLLDAARRLLELGGRDDGPLGENRDRDEAILFNVMLMGEGARRVSPRTRERFPEIPWREMAGTRDRVIHHYEGVDWTVLGEIIATDLPPLVPKLQSVRDLVAGEL